MPEQDSVPALVKLLGIDLKKAKELERKIYSYMARTEDIDAIGNLAPAIMLWTDNKKEAYYAGIIVTTLSISLMTIKNEAAWLEIQNSVIKTLKLIKEAIAMKN